MAGKPLTQERKNEMLEQCFNCYCEYGLASTGVKALGTACGISAPTLLSHFGTVDNIIIKSTEYCMLRVENEFIEKAPVGVADIEQFIKEIPYWTAEHHGEKYRFMYQVYSSPKYLEYGKKFFRDVAERYTEYAKMLAPKLNIPWQMLRPMIFTFVRAVVHFAMFGEEEYLQSQLGMLLQAAKIMIQNPETMTHTLQKQEEEQL